MLHKRNRTIKNTKLIKNRVMKPNVLVFGLEKARQDMNRFISNNNFLKVNKDLLKLGREFDKMINSYYDQMEMNRKMQ